MTRARDSKKEGESPKAAWAARAQAAYRDGNSWKALELWGGFLERSDLEPKEKLEARFWYASSLHGVGRYEAACQIVEPICFDPDALATSPSWVYRIATRAALIQIDLARPLEQTEALLARIADLAAAARDPRRSRYWLVQGHLETARGRPVAALRALERGLEAKDHTPHCFASTRYFRAIVPLLLQTGRLEDARQALECWQQSGDPDAFKHPHLPACHADWLRARGDTEAALRHAMFAFDRAQQLDEIAGRLSAGWSLCSAALLCGDVRQTRAGLRALLRERGRTSPEDRFRLDLTAADVYLGLACLQAGLPVPDFQYGGEVAIEIQASGPCATAAERALSDASRACERALRSARAVDAVFGSRFRTAASRRRNRFLRALRRRVRRTRLAGTPCRENRAEPGGGPDAMRLKAATTQPGAPTGEPAARPTLALSSDGSKSWLVTPAEDLAGLAKEFLASGRRIFVPYLANRDAGFDFDLWVDGELAGSGRASISTSCSDPEPRFVIETEDAPPPDWLARLAEEAKRHEGRRHFRRGEVALEAGEIDLAAKDFAVAVALQPDWATAWERSARCLLARGRAEKAFEASLRSLEIDSSDPQGWTTLGRVFEAQGHPSQAQAAQQQARERQQEHDDDNNDDASSVQDMLSGVDPGPF
jgi:tetratricopeptide (TPR) repeat protein